MCPFGLLRRLFTTPVLLMAYSFRLLEEGAIDSSKLGAFLFSLVPNQLLLPGRCEKPFSLRQYFGSLRFFLPRVLKAKWENSYKASIRSGAEGGHHIKFVQNLAIWIGASCSGSSRCLSGAPDAGAFDVDKGKATRAKETWEDAVPEGWSIVLSSSLF